MNDIILCKPVFTTRVEYQNWKNANQTVGPMQGAFHDYI